MHYSFTLHSLEELVEKAPEIAQVLPSSGVIVFKGEMAAGKTTTIAQLCKAWGVEDTVQSPTFSLVNEYRTKSGETIFHFDFYRLEDEEEALDMGYEDYFYSKARCLVEWPEKIPTLLPSTITLLTITSVNGVRHIEIDVPQLSQ
ncbi:MAG: tRNA (adenosine(37)-N6)-threonylcarbamoyltransferase complex ATPase subunit type 1 TsaE [Bacteroidetes bacterium]|nr:MAG: tRNA (adenosine(37)-N6)-threonylcarbamoyltransferase complex ATPase subunit type 1 TsaE [Bacteroidota bacterium]